MDFLSFEFWLSVCDGFAHLASQLRLTLAPSMVIVSLLVSLYRMSGASTTFEFNIFSLNIFSGNGAARSNKSKVSRRNCVVCHVRAVVQLFDLSLFQKAFEILFQMINDKMSQCNNLVQNQGTNKQTLSEREQRDLKRLGAHNGKFYYINSRKLLPLIKWSGLVWSLNNYCFWQGSQIWKIKSKVEKFLFLRITLAI